MNYTLGISRTTIWPTLLRMGLCPGDAPSNFSRTYINYWRINMLFENYASSFTWELLPLHGIDQNNRCECGNAHSGDHSAGKHPATSNGLKDASSDPNTIRQWSETYSNFGLYCKTSNIAVIDIDPRNGGFESWESLTAPMPDIVPDIRVGFILPPHFSLLPSASFIESATCCPFI